MEAGGYLFGTAGRIKGEQSTPLSQLPPLCPALCAMWRCRAGGIDPPSCLAQPLEILVLTSLMSAHIALN